MNKRKNIVNKENCLKVNSNWTAIEWTSIKDAIVALAGDDTYKSLDIIYPTNSDGSYNLDEEGNPTDTPINIIPLSWNDWIKVKVRPFDLSIHYNNGNSEMRAPTVIVSLNYSRVPKRKFKDTPTRQGVIIRDNSTDQITGEKLKNADCSIDHIIPRSKGGGHVWSNVILTSKKNNSKKGDKFLDELGWTLIKEPKKPNSIPVSVLIKEPKHSDQKPFINK